MKILLALLFCVSTFADWNVQMSGEGQSSTLSGAKPCEFIEMRFLQPSPGKFTIRGGGYKCGIVQAEYPYSTFDIVDGKLVYEGEVHGEISDDTFHLTAEDNQFNLWITRREDGSYFYRELWADGDDFFKVEGSLSVF